MLADPYGTDEADLAVRHYVVFTLRMSKEILISNGSSSAGSDGGGGGRGRGGDDDDDGDDDDGGGGGGGGGGAIKVMETPEFSREMETAEKQMELRGAFGRLAHTLDIVGTRKGGGGLNVLERITGWDLDRDGDVGAQGTNQQVVFNTDSSPIHGTRDLGLSSPVPGSVTSVRSITVAPAVTQTHEPDRGIPATYGGDSRAHASQLHMDFQEDVSATEDRMQRRRRASIEKTQARLVPRRVAAGIDAGTRDKVKP